MLVRLMRIMAASVFAPSISAGNTRCRHPPTPVAGNHLSITQNKIWLSMPSQNAGSENSSIARIMLP